MATLKSLPHPWNGSFNKVQEVCRHGSCEVVRNLVEIEFPRCLSSRRQEPHGLGVFR